MLFWKFWFWQGSCSSPDIRESSLRISTLVQHFGPPPLTPVPDIWALLSNLGCSMFNPAPWYCTWDSTKTVAQVLRLLPSMLCTQMDSWLLALVWPIPSCCIHLGSESGDRRISPSLSVTVFPIKRKQIWLKNSTFNIDTSEQCLSTWWFCLWRSFGNVCSCSSQLVRWHRSSVGRSQGCQHTSFKTDLNTRQRMTHINAWLTLSRPSSFKIRSSLVLDPVIKMPF